MRRPLVTSLIAGIALSAVLACGGGPRQDPVPYHHARTWDEVLTVRVIEWWDLVYDHVDTAPQVTHVVEVEIVDGPPRYVGQIITLPYDSYATDTVEPPATGTTLIMTPSSWVTPGRGGPRVPGR